MEYYPRVQIIPVKPKPRDKRVAIYARVSSNSAEQLNSLTTQISGLTRLTAANPTWLLVDTYIDIALSKTGSHRKEFNRLLADCTANKVDIVLTKILVALAEIHLKFYQLWSNYEKEILVLYLKRKKRTAV